MRQSITKFAERIVLRHSDPDTHSKFRLVAVFARGSRVISYGYNSFLPLTGQQPFSRHAEEAALSRVPHDLIGDGDLYICRALADGTYGMARPCPSCMEAIREAGIDTIHYSLDNNNGWASEEIVY